MGKNTVVVTLELETEGQQDAKWLLDQLCEQLVEENDFIASADWIEGV